MGWAQPITREIAVLICADPLIGKDRQATLGDFGHGPSNNDLL
jgi:hypothetical protein